MKKKGFTLVELLAVIVILAIILAIAIPGISGIVSNTTKAAFESDAKMILKQLDYAKLTNDSYDVTTTTKDSIVSDFKLSNANYEEVTVGIVDNKPYILITGKNKWKDLKACGTIGNMKVVPITDATTCEDVTAPTPAGNWVASEGVNKPRLAQGMTAIKWNSGTSSWDTVSNPDTDTSWYNYANKEWANAKTADGSMWVWIPRYAYQIETNYHTSTAGTINVKFLKDNTNVASDASTVDTAPTYSGSSQTNFIKHPAFTFDTTELTGMWVAKFEMSGTTASLDSKPGIASLRSTTVANMFTASRNMETNAKYGWALASNLGTNGVFTTDGNGVDTHMMKNSEWGAVAYLSQSSFGKNAEITINNSSSYYTGGGTGTAYMTNVNQSTTGNIYGIYDISGGSWEYVMGNYNNVTGDSGLTPVSIHNKYIDRYSTTPYTASVHGDAVYETSNGTSGSTSWHGDYSYIIESSYPWFMRGGGYSLGSDAGAFSFDSRAGGVGVYISWRSLLLVEAGL